VVEVPTGAPSTYSVFMTLSAEATPASDRTKKAALIIDISNLYFILPSPFLFLMLFLPFHHAIELKTS
jgi:hypothetical protein